MGVSRSFSSIMAVAVLATLAATSDGAPVVDGAIGPGEYSIQLAGRGTGFDNGFGAGSTLHVDFSSTSLFLGIEAEAGGDDFLSGGQDSFVIYFDTIAGGAASTADIRNTTASFPARQVATGSVVDATVDPLTGVSTETSTGDLTFAPGFEADFVLTQEFGSVFEQLFAFEAAPAIGGGNNIDESAASETLGFQIDVAAGDLGFVALADAGFDSTVREFEISLATLGLSEGDTFRLLGTVVAASTFRSGQYIGDPTVADTGNTGNNPVILGAGDFVELTVVPVPEPTSLMLVAVGSVAALRRRRLA